MSWGFVAVAAATVVGGVIASDASKDASKASAAGTASSIEESQRQFDLTREDFAPTREAGLGALEQQQALIGLSGQEAQQAALGGLEVSAGQQFIRDRAQKNLLRNQAAIGGLGGGNVRTALVEQGAGFAQQDIQNQFGRLGQIAGQGQAATTAGAQIGGQISQGIANTQFAAGQNRAGAIQQQSNIQQQTIGGLANVAGQFAARPSPPPPLQSNPTRSQIFTG